jgi:hypothetical protein
MPEVRAVTVTFGRSVQPVQYESKMAEVSVAANFSEAEYQAGGMAGALLEVKLAVLGALGLQNEIDATLAAAGAARPDPKPVTPKTGKVKSTTAEPPKAPASDAASAADMTGSAPAVSTADGEPKPVTDEDLQKAAAAASKLVGAAKVKEMMKGAGVARLGELAADKRLDFVKALEGLKKE